ncbi:biotin synthase domain protein, partial [Chlamydia psittaci 06-1683]
SMLIITT